MRGTYVSYMEAFTGAVPWLVATRDQVVAVAAAPVSRTRRSAAATATTTPSHRAMLPLRRCLAGAICTHWQSAARRSHAPPPHAGARRAAAQWRQWWLCRGTEVAREQNQQHRRFHFFDTRQVYLGRTLEPEAPAHAQVLHVGRTAQLPTHGACVMHTAVGTSGRGGCATTCVHVRWELLASNDEQESGAEKGRQWID